MKTASGPQLMDWDGQPMLPAERDTGRQHGEMGGG